MTIYYVNTGSSPNAGDGDSLRVAFTKINNNFEILETLTLNTTTATVNWLSVPSSIIPSADLAYDLGSTSSQWRSLYVGTSTIYIGGVPIGINVENNTLVVGLEPGQESTTATTVATEKYVIDYVTQFGGANLEIDGGDAFTIYTAEIEIDGGGA